MRMESIHYVLCRARHRGCKHCHVAWFPGDSHTSRPRGEPSRNLGIGCDRYLEDVPGPELHRLRADRLAARGVGA